MPKITMDYYTFETTELTRAERKLMHHNPIHHTLHEHMTHDNILVLAILFVLQVN